MNTTTAGSGGEKVPLTESQYLQQLCLGFAWGNLASADSISLPDRDLQKLILDEQARNQNLLKALQFEAKHMLGWLAFQNDMLAGVYQRHLSIIHGTQQPSIKSEASSPVSAENNHTGSNKSPKPDIKMLKPTDSFSILCQVATCELSEPSSPLDFLAQECANDSAMSASANASIEDNDSNVLQKRELPQKPFRRTRKSKIVEDQIPIIDLKRKRVTSVTEPVSAEKLVVWNHEEEVILLGVMYNRFLYNGGMYPTSSKTLKMIQDDWDAFFPGQSQSDGSDEGLRSSNVTRRTVSLLVISSVFHYLKKLLFNDNVKRTPSALQRRFKVIKNEMNAAPPQPGAESKVFALIDEFERDYNKDQRIIDPNKMDDNAANVVFQYERTSNPAQNEKSIFGAASTDKIIELSILMHRGQGKGDPEENDSNSTQGDEELSEKLLAQGRNNGWSLGREAILVGAVVTVFKHNGGHSTSYGSLPLSQAAPDADDPNDPNGNEKVSWGQIKKVHDELSKALDPSNKFVDRQPATLLRKFKNLRDEISKARDAGQRPRRTLNDLYKVFLKMQG